MILKPITAYPSNGAVIDADLKTQFYTTIQGSSAEVTGYEYAIYDASTFKQEDQLGKLNLPTPLNAGDVLSFQVDNQHAVFSGQTMAQNGNAYYWILRLYQKNADMFVGNGVVSTVDSTTSFTTENNNNIKAGMYVKFTYLKSEEDKLWLISTIYRNKEKGTMQVILKDENSELNKYIYVSFKVFTRYLDSQPFYFLARKTPTLSINAPDIINSMKYTFTANYSQKDGDGIKWYKYTLTDATGVEYDSTGEVYSSDLKYVADGLIEGQAYNLVCTVCTINNVIVQDSFSFSPSYTAPIIDRGIRAAQLPDRDGIRLTWADNYETTGKASGEYTLDNSILNITSGNITYSGVTTNEEKKQDYYITEDSTVLTDVTITQDTNEIISLEKTTYDQDPEIKTMNFFNSGYPTTINGKISDKFTGMTFSDCAYGNGVYVVVGYMGQAYRSTDLDSWVRMSGLSPDEKYENVCYGGGLFVTVSSFGHIFYSSDGMNWTDSQNLTKPCNCIGYGNGNFIIGCNSGVTYLATSLMGSGSSSESWTALTVITDTPKIKEIKFLNNKLVCACDNGKLYSYGTDSGWTLLGDASSYISNIYSVEYLNNQYILLGSQNTYATSDFSTYTEITNMPSLYATNNYTSATRYYKKVINSGNNIYAHKGSYIYYISGNKWKELSGVFPEDASLTYANFFYLGNKYIFLGGFTPVLYGTSIKKDSWILGSFGLSPVMFYGVSNENTTLVVGNYGQCFVSYNGKTWQEVDGLPKAQQKFTSRNPLMSRLIAYGDGCYVCNYDDSLWALVDGGKWQKITGRAVIANRITYGNGAFFILVAGNKLYTITSQNIKAQNLQATEVEGFSTYVSQKNITVYDICAADETLVLCGESGFSADSVDGGETWSRVPIVTSSDIYSVNYGNKKFVCTGENKLTAWSEKIGGGEWKRTFSKLENN